MSPFLKIARKLRVKEMMLKMGDDEYGIFLYRREKIFDLCIKTCIIFVHKTCIIPLKTNMSPEN